MAKGAYIGIGGAARKVKALYEGVSGAARKVKKAYIGVNGVARESWIGENGEIGTLPQSFTCTVTVDMMSHQGESTVSAPMLFSRNSASSYYCHDARIYTSVNGQAYVQRAGIIDVPESVWATVGDFILYVGGGSTNLTKGGTVGTFDIGNAQLFPLNQDVFISGTMFL